MRKGSGRTPTCHPERRHKAKGLCESCYALPYSEAWARRKAGRKRANNTRSRLARGRLIEHLRERYGLTIEAYYALLRAQCGQCLCCKEHMLEPCVDHCHDTGRVRALLCAGCNLGVGRVEHPMHDRWVAYVRTWHGVSA